MRTIDLNADLGEGSAHDAAILEYVSSVNVACGGHAGDIATMRRVVVLAKEREVAIGAHPGYEDREHFGRRELALPADIVFGLLIRQIGALEAVARAAGVEISHVKPHGALYNQAARDPRLAAAVVAAAGEGRAIFAPADSELTRMTEAAGKAHRWPVAEVFADRRYRADGTLVPRNEPGAVIASVDAAVEQALDLVMMGRVRTVEGGWRTMRAETICVHGDGPEALELTRALRTALTAAGVVIRAPSRPAW